MDETNLFQRINADFSILNNIFQDEKRLFQMYEILYPFIIHEEIKLAQTMGNKYLAIAFWISRKRNSYNTSKTKDLWEIFEKELLSKNIKRSENNNTTNEVTRGTDITSGQEETYAYDSQNDQTQNPKIDKKKKKKQNLASNHVNHVQYHDQQHSHMTGIQQIPSAADSHEVSIGELIKINDEETNASPKGCELETIKYNKSEIWYDLSTLDQDTLMTDAEQVGSTLEEFESALKEDTPSNSRISNDIEIQNELLEVSTKDGKPYRSIKRPRALLSKLKNQDNKTSHEFTQISIHEVEEDSVATFDAYIKIEDIRKYNTIEDKRAYIELNVRNHKGFITTEYNATDKQIIIKYNREGAMRLSVRKFNHIFKQELIKMTPKKYFTHERKRMSSHDFKIIDLPSKIDKEEIKKGIRSILNGAIFFLKDHVIPSSSNKDTCIYYFTVKDNAGLNVIKNHWSIEINGNLYRLAPAHFKLEDFQLRKKFRAEFIGFDEEHTATKAIEITAPYGPKNAYKQSSDKIIVEFESEATLFNACEKTYNFGQYTVKGKPCNYLWAKDNPILAGKKKRPAAKPVQDTVTLDNIHRTSLNKNNDITSPDTNTNQYKATGANTTPLGKPSRVNKQFETIEEEKKISHINITNKNKITNITATGESEVEESC